VVFEDVTSRKAEALRDQKRAEFEKQLIGIVSHDLRTPVGAISLGAALLAKDATLTERQANLVDRVVSSAGRASRMIADLLDFTAVRLGGGLALTLAPLDLHELARKVIAEVLLAAPLQRHIDLEHTGDASGVWDGDRLSQLITNLIANALHYSPRSSAVRVVTHGEADHVTLEVHNGGPPIPESLLPRLFLPMQRGIDEVEPSRRSVGLGLFIVDEITRAHQGTIDVRSTAEAGTSFSVRLPRALST
jgi:signal transduction histidine kinase